VIWVGSKSNYFCEQDWTGVKSPGCLVNSG
jgi:hypothetical protein